MLIGDVNRELRYVDVATRKYPAPKLASRPGCDKEYLEFEDYGSLPNGPTGARE